ncbi:hypothetical protein [Kitasatospora mediocidica]|uniref:hypothetical protein n=1 Tax=Kitasatospora mediocidica TaxID=58352 RepID=UPI000562E125|nr:hypothetical protein [Kitasatospora mediocidica]
MTGIEVAVACMVAWAARKAKRVAGRVDAEVDHGLDAAMDHLHDVVSRKLGEDRALARLTEDAEAGQSEPTNDTRQWLQFSLQDAVQRDPGFAEALQQAVTRYQAAAEQGGGQAGGTTLTGNTFSGPTALQFGSNNRQENHFGPRA